MEQNIEMITTFSQTFLYKLIMVNMSLFLYLFFSKVGSESYVCYASSNWYYFSYD